jgi:hypothetical protein
MLALLSNDVDDEMLDLGMIIYMGAAKIFDDLATGMPIGGMCMI